MQRCTYCGYELPLNVRFCGRCGRLLDPTTAPDEVTTRSNQDQAMLLDIPPAGALMGSEQPYGAHVPVVQGTPQAGGVPMVPGSSSPAGGLSPVQPFSPGPAPSAFA